jgi:hypothetical protein
MLHAQLIQVEKGSEHAAFKYGCQSWLVTKPCFFKKIYLKFIFLYRFNRLMLKIILKNNFNINWFRMFFINFRSESRV